MVRVAPVDMDRVSPVERDVGPIWKQWTKTDLTHMFGTEHQHVSEIGLIQLNWLGLKKINTLLTNLVIFVHEFQSPPTGMIFITNWKLLRAGQI